MEKLQAIGILLRKEDGSILENIEQIGINKWDAINKDAKEVAEAMIAQGQEQKEAQKYYDENSWGLGDMISWMRDQFGELAELAVLFNAYNGQVCNGGHQQYIDNDYASGNYEGFFANSSDSLQGHKALIELFHRYAEIPLQQQALDVMNSLELVEQMYDCECCCGAGEIEEYDEEGGNLEYIWKCDDCDGDGQIPDGWMPRRPEKQDDAWYAINDEVCKQLEDFYSAIMKTSNEESFLCLTTDQDIEQSVNKVLPEAKVEELGKEDENFVYRVTNPHPLTRLQEKTMVEDFGADL